METAIEKPHGCHNKPTAKASLVVFDGYHDIARTRVKVAVVPHPFDNICHYSKDFPDPRCAGCIHQVTK